MPEMDTDTPIAGVNTRPLNTDSETQEKTSVESEVTTEDKTSKVPSVEQRDGKMFVDGVRVFTRDDTNKIAANARRDTEQSLLKELNVDDLKQVKTVVNQLQTANIEESTSLDVNSLRDAVKKREQTVDELRNELQRVKTDAVLVQHLSQLQNEMPKGWESEQKKAVIDLMKARDMFAVEGETFAIRNGEDFLTTDGETPDYKSAVELIGKNLGLPFSKKGASTFDGDRGDSVKPSNSAINEDRIKNDSLYRSAYVSLRDSNKHMARSQITDGMITKHMKKIEDLRSGQLR